MKCVTGKKIYITRELAEDALIDTRIRFDYAANDGPVNVYKCEDCGYFHLTSKGVMNGRLGQLYAEGRIHREKEAAKWQDKFKRR